MMSHPVWLPGPMFLLGVSVSGPIFLPGGLCPGGFLSKVGGNPPGIRIVGGTHITGMLSCLKVQSEFSVQSTIKKNSYRQPL